MTMTLIETKTLGSTQAAVEFTSIPQTFDDLIIVVSARTDRNTGPTAPLGLRFNSLTTGYSGRRLYGFGSTVATDQLATNQAGTQMIIAGMNCTAASTSNTFGSSSIYITNYRLSVNKSVSGNGSAQTNATDSENALLSGLWSNTSSITTLSLHPYWTGESFVSGTMVSLYGILKGSSGGVIVS